MAAQDAHPFHWPDDDGPDVGDKNFHLHGAHDLFLLFVVLFSLLLLIILLCLYVKWACCCPAGTGQPGPHPVSSPDGTTQFPSGLDAGSIKNLSVVLYHRQALDGNEEEEEAQCSICLGVLAEGDKVKILPLCGHNYHPECIDRWLRTQSSCPLCRASLILEGKDAQMISLDAC